MFLLSTWEIRQAVRGSFDTVVALRCHFWSCSRCSNPVFDQMLNLIYVGAFLLHVLYYTICWMSENSEYYPVRHKGESAVRIRSPLASETFLIAHYCSSHSWILLALSNSSEPFNYSVYSHKKQKRQEIQQWMCFIWNRIEMTITNQHSYSKQLQINYMTVG